MDDETLTEDDREYQRRLDALPKPGTRVRLTCIVERYPHFRAPRGARGTVSEATEEVFSVRMDENLPGAEDWQNEVHWYPRNCDQWPDDEIEVLDEPRDVPEVVNDRAEEDPQIIEAILNIQMAIRRISKFGSNQDIAEAVADLEQAMRFLRDEEVPS